jgi:hypothetical protein
MNATQHDDDTAPIERAHESAESAARPVLLSWKDPEEGETLWVEMWGSREFIDDLVAQGFEVRRIEDDESASSLCVRILHRVPEATGGDDGIADPSVGPEASARL